MAGVGSTLFLIVKWSGNEYKIELNESFTVLNLKYEIKKVTGVLPERQKLMGLKFKGEQESIGVSLSSFFPSYQYLVSGQIFIWTFRHLSK